MRRRTLFLFFLAYVFANAQRFEVASVKPAGPERDGRTAYRVGPGTDDPERITFERQSMLRLPGVAYGLDWDQIAGPAWIATENYSVEAKVPPGTFEELAQVTAESRLDGWFLHCLAPRPAALALLRNR